jgi:hypothetical protein
MITLTIIVLIWCVLSYYRIHQKSKYNNREFNPFDGTFLDYGGVVVGTPMLLLLFLYFITKYLP